MGTLKSILRQANLKLDEFEEICNK